MKILSILTILFSFCIPAFSQNQTDGQERIESMLKARSNEFQSAQSLAYIQPESINKFNCEKQKKQLFTWKRKAAIRTIEENLYTLNHLLKWESVLKNRVKNIPAPHQPTPDCENPVKVKLDNILSSKFTSLDTISKIKGLNSFETHRSSLYQFIKASIDYDKALLEYDQALIKYLSCLIKNTEVNLKKNSEYQRQKQQADYQIASLEIDIYKRMVKLNFDLEKFSQKKYSHIIKDN